MKKLMLIASICMGVVVFNGCAWYIDNLKQMWNYDGEKDCQDYVAKAKADKNFSKNANELEKEKYFQCLKKLDKK